MTSCRRWPRTTATCLSCLVLAVAAQAQERQISIPLERWGIGDRPGAASIEVTDGQGRDVTAETRQQVVGGELRLALPDRGQYVVRPGEVINLPMPGERTVLPGGVLHSETDDELEELDEPDALVEPREVWFRPTIFASPLPASWDASVRRYRTELLLGLQLPAEATGTSLDNPVTMRLGFRGMTADPVGEVRLTQAGLEHEQRVALHFLPTTPAPVLELRSTFGDLDLEMAVLPRIELRPLSDSVAGFGLGTVAVDVAHLLPHGVEAPVDADTAVSLEIRGAARPVEDRVVIARGNSHARFTLRSTGVGPVVVTATARGLSDQRTIEQAFPFLPLLAALLGGAVGGYSRRFQKAAPAVPARARILEGILVATVVYAAIVAGVATVAIPAVIAATEVGAFVTGALAGFVGVTLIEALSRNVQPVQG